MTVRNLEYLFHPKSVAVVFEPNEPSHYAEVILDNLAKGGYTGPVIPVAVRGRSIFGFGIGIGMGSHVTLDKLKEAPDLAVVCAALDDAPEIIAQLGARGTRAVLVGSSMRESLGEREMREAHKAILDAARPHLIRVLGPGSHGLLVPGSALNASLPFVGAKPGKIALIAQSAALASAVVERAYSRSIGFSTVLHLGSSLDIDLPDILDWLASDPATETILVQFDAVVSGRKFMSAARAVARGKRVFAIRSGRVQARHPTVSQLTRNQIYEAAMRRAGWVSIDTLDDLFETIEASTRVRPLRGERLSIISNGKGFGRIATDALLGAGGRLATFSSATEQQLAEVLQTSSLPLGNPLALPANSTPADWANALTTVLADASTDAVLTICSPSPFAQGGAVATALCEVAQRDERNVFTCWVGGTAMLVAENIAAAQGVFSHNSPEKTVAAFLGAVHYQRNREQLMQMPPSIADDFTPNVGMARAVITEAIDAEHTALSARQARNLLHAYGINVQESQPVTSMDAAIHAAEGIGYPVDMALVLSNQNKSDLVASSLRSPEDIRIAARGLRSSARSQYPGHRVLGYRLCPSVARSGIAALRIGVADDPVFGPVIYLGTSSATGTLKDAFAASLLPLNQVLARELIERSRCIDDAPPEQREVLASALNVALVRVSHVLTDIDELANLEIDPLHLEASGVVALDVRIHVVKRQRKNGFRRFAIRPYPKELEQHVDWDGRKLLIRPIRPEDETIFSDFIGALDPADSRMRFFITMKRLPRSQLARFTQIDYDREMALVVIERDEDGCERSLGEVRAIADPDNATAEFAIVIGSDLKGKGLGRLLMQNIIDYCRSCGTGELRGETLGDNQRMQHLARELGFQLTPSADGTVKLCLPLREPRQES